jgi:hypothetical protein
MPSAGGKAATCGGDGRARRRAPGLNNRYWVNNKVAQYHCAASWRLPRAARRYFNSHCPRLTRRGPAGGQRTPLEAVERFSGAASRIGRRRRPSGIVPGASTLRRLDARSQREHRGNREIQCRVLPLHWWWANSNSGFSASRRFKTQWLPKGSVKTTMSPDTCGALT